MPTLEQFKNARSVLKGVIRETSLIDSPALSKGCGNRVYLKPENMQVTGAYKIRGAYYKISTLTQEQRERGLVTASAGNHAQGVAYAAQAAGVPATIVMPTTTPLVKVNNTKDYGAKVILHGEVFDDVRRAGRQAGGGGGADLYPPLQRPGRWPPARAPSPMRSSRTCPTWTSSWCPSAAAGWPRVCPPWPSCSTPT